MNEVDREEEGSKVVRKLPKRPLCMRVENSSKGHLDGERRSFVVRSFS